MSSQDMTITHHAITQRAKQDALDAIPEMPKESTVDAWESYIQRLEDLDAYEIAHESSEWDWCIYYHRAMKLCQAVPSAVLHEAESEYNDCGGFGDLDVGLYELATHLAHLIVSQAIREAVEECRDELLELANDKLEQMESV